MNAKTLTTLALWASVIAAIAIPWGIVLKEYRSTIKPADNYAVLLELREQLKDINEKLEELIHE